MNDVEVDIAGERVMLLPERAAFWVSQRTLLVADAHIGKAAAFRASAIPVPRGTTSEALDRLTRLVARTNAARILFLGDLLHAREGRDAETLRSLVEWRAGVPAVEVALIRGNHDRGAGDPPREAGIVCFDPPVREAPFAFTHHPSVDETAHVIAGHLHPGALLIGPGRQFERLPCFRIGPRVSVLPAFGDFTGLGNVETDSGDRVYVIGDGAVIAIPSRR